MVKLKRFITQRPDASVALSLSHSPTLFFNINSLHICILWPLTDSRFLSPFRTYLKPSIFLFLLSFRNCLRIRKDNRLEARFVSMRIFFHSPFSLTLCFFVCARREKKGKNPFLWIWQPHKANILHIQYIHQQALHILIRFVSLVNERWKRSQREKSTHNKYGLKTVQLHKRRSSTTLN